MRISVFLFHALLALAIVPSLSAAADGPLSGFGNARFGMSRTEIRSQLSEHEVIKENSIRTQANFRIRGHHPWTTYIFDKDDKLSQIQLENNAPATFQDCFTSYQLYLQFLSAHHGRADYLFQDTHDQTHLWRAMFLFQDGGAVHLNVNFGLPDGCTTAVSFLPTPIEAQMAVK